MKRREQGFTMIELIVAMAVFSFILLIIVVGFLNVVSLRNQALASDMAQDNARTAMNELVRAVRDAADVTIPSYPVTTTSNTLCLTKVDGHLGSYELVPPGILTRYDGCGPGKSNPVAITNTGVDVVDFTAKQESFGPGVKKPEIQLSITVASNNGTTVVAGASTQCKDTNQDRKFCSTVTLTSGAVAR